MGYWIFSSVFYSIIYHSGRTDMIKQIIRKFKGTPKQRKKQKEALEKLMEKLQIKIDTEYLKMLNEVAEKAAINLNELIKKHTRSQHRKMMKYMKDNNLHDLIFLNATEWRKLHKTLKPLFGTSDSSMVFVNGTFIGKVTKSQEDDQAFSYIASLFHSDADYSDWFNQDDFNGAFRETQTKTYGAASGTAFSNINITFNTKMRQEQIADYLASRTNKIKDLPFDNFTDLQRTLKDLYYDKGLNPNEIAKHLEFKNLWDETYKNRSKRIAVTETRHAQSNARRDQFENKGFLLHYWRTAADGKVRDEHVANQNDGKIPLHQAFSSGQKFPYDGSDPALIVFCRCVELATSVDPKDDRKLILTSELDSSLPFGATADDKILFSSLLAYLNLQQTLKVVFDSDWLKKYNQSAMYNEATDTVVLSNSQWAQDNVWFFSHELSHSTGYSKRLDRNFGFSRVDDNYEEAVSTLAPIFLAEKLGIQVSQAYKSYANKFFTKFEKTLPEGKSDVILSSVTKDAKKAANEIFRYN